MTPNHVRSSSVGSIGRPTILLFALSLAFVAAAAPACSDDPKRPAVLADETAPPRTSGSIGGGDGGSKPGPTADDPDGGACTDLENTGPLVDESVVNEELPAGAGGEIADGTYDITDVRLHQGLSALPGPTGASYQGSIRVTGTTYERVVVFKSSTGAGSEVRSAGTFTPSGINATIALTCPSPTQEQVTYSVLNDTLTVSNLVTKASFVFTKRP